MRRRVLVVMTCLVIFSMFSLLSLLSCAASLPWDVNGDGYVGVDDITYAAEHFGESPGRPRWDPTCDMNADDYIGIDDILQIALHFGQTDP